MKKIIISIAICLMSVIAVAAKPIDDAKSLYNSGKYMQAIEKLEAIVKASPKDGTANYYLGMCYLALNKPALAKDPLKIAEDKGIANASKELAALALKDYRMDDADSHVATWEKLLHKNKKPIPEELGKMRSKIVMTKNMLERVEKVVVTDSIIVDKKGFFNYYGITPAAGKLLDADVLTTEYSSQNPNVVFEPESNREVFWAMPVGGKNLEIVSARILDDGSFEDPQPLGSVLNDGGDADYPFFMADGIAFYFANNGDNSIGGYDIFMSRRSPDGTVLNPQNVGMPYNSPYDDYMMVIDEATGRGWWATDRNQIPGKVTIYSFIPNEVRENYDSEAEDIADYAMLRSIKATQKGANVPPSGNVFEKQTPKAVSKPLHFVLPLGNGRIYTQLSDFKNAKAKQAMQQYADNLRELDLMKAKLAILRQQYAEGDRSVSDEILSLEKRMLAADPIMKKLRNQAISYELGN